MKQIKRISIILVVLVALMGCTARDPEVDDETPPDQQIVQTTREGDYEMVYPFTPSPLRQIRSIGSREVESHEIGRRLLDKSKEHFSVNSYYVSEGQMLDEDRYLNLLIFQSEDNPDGLMTRYPEGLDIDGVTLINPVFVSDIFEYNFHRKNDENTMDGISLAIVLKRYQVLDQNTGIMHALSDDALYNIGQTIGLQLGAYMRSLEGVSNVPIYIGLYVQSSDIDQLPGNYLPGYFIGEAYSSDSSMSFSRNYEQWMLLSEARAQSLLPEIVSQFNQLKQKVIHFTGDESVGLIGKVFIADNNLEMIRLEVNVPSKTFLETYGLGQYLSHEIEGLASFDVSVKVNINVYDKTRGIIVKNPGSSPIFEIFE